MKMNLILIYKILCRYLLILQEHIKLLTFYFISNELVYIVKERSIVHVEVYKGELFSWDIFCSEIVSLQIHHRMQPTFITHQQ